MGFENKVGTVTGAASGIGRASAIAFAKEGATVIVSDINEKLGQETVEIIKEFGGKAEFIRCDVTNEEDVKSLIDTTVERFGKLDFAHNNAGQGAEPVHIGELPTESWNRCIQLTQQSLYYCLKYQVNAMKLTGGGAIVNTSSANGLVGMENNSAYSAAKWAVNGLTKTVALEYGKDGIRVNSFCPGMTRTPAVDQWAAINPEQAKTTFDNIALGRMCEPEEQADVAVYLCSDKASYITGVNLASDGGFTAK